MVQRTCDIEGCPRPHKSKGLCDTHYCQVRHGRTITPLEPISRIICSFPGCGRTKHAYGLCIGHLAQQKRGAVLSDLRLVKRFETLSERFEAMLDRDAPNGCWVWLGSRGRLGYGVTPKMGEVKSAIAHRAYLQLLGYEVPDGMHVDHLCRNPPCCNPEHLEVVTPRENILRGVGASATNAAKTHCVNGHEFTEENTYLRPDNGGRQCRTCNHERSKARAAREKAERAEIR